MPNGVFFSKMRSGHQRMSKVVMVLCIRMHHDEPWYWGPQDDWENHVLAVACTSLHFEPCDGLLVTRRRFIRTSDLRCFARFYGFRPTPLPFVSGADATLKRRQPDTGKLLPDVCPVPRQKKLHAASAPHPVRLVTHLAETILYNGHR